MCKESGVGSVVETGQRWKLPGGKMKAGDGINTAWKNDMFGGAGLSTMTVMFSI